MKKLISLVLAVLMSFYSVPLLGEEPTETPTKQSMFASQKGCEDALKSGNFSYYQPVNTGSRGKNQIDNEKVFPVKLEADQCRLQKTMKGEMWVIQAGGTLMRARKDASGELVIFARNDCGNEDKTPVVVDPTPSAMETPTSEPVLAPAPTPAISTAKEEVVPPPTPVEPLKLDIRVKYDPPPTTPPPNTGIVVKKKSHTWLYVVGGLLLASGVAALASGGKKSGDPPGGSTGPAF